MKLKELMSVLVITEGYKIKINVVSYKGIDETIHSTEIFNINDINNDYYEKTVMCLHSMKCNTMCYDYNITLIK